MNDISRHSITRRLPAVRRRGVASVLAMLFIVVFGSLTAVMAIVAQGNLRTAASYLRVSRATSAAETGLVFARHRLDEVSRRFVVTKGVIDSDFGTKLWLGTWTSSDGEVIVRPAVHYTENPLPRGLAEALRNAHLADLHNVELTAGDALLPDIDEFGTLRVRPIAVDHSDNSAHFRLRYELLADGRFIRVTSQGVDGDITRTLSMEFEINKKIEFAVISPNRIMIGKNVRVEGPLGSRYGIVSGELDPVHGNPIIMRSDFYYLDPALDAVLDKFFAAVEEYDVVGDGRLRPNHPIESLGLTDPDLVDYTGDGYVTDFDLFMAHFDADGDGRVVYDTDLAFAAGHGVVSLEFDADLQLARLIDFANPDRNADGVVDSIDTALGWGDGIIDANDYYAKVQGRFSFAVSRQDWEDARGHSFQRIVQGPIRSEADQAPVTFNVTEEDLLDITTADFQGTQTWMKATALAGQDFESQVAANLSSGEGSFTEADASDWETVPYNAVGYYDWYRRPVYENMTFSNVTIPMGNNGLFINCTFIGVTYVQTHTSNEDVNWNYIGMLDRNAITGEYVPKYPGLATTIGGEVVTSTREYSNNIRFDSCTFAGSIIADATNEYTHVRNKIQFTGSTTFTLDHPSLTPEAKEELAKSSIMMPGYSVDVGNFSNELDHKVELKGTIIAGILDARGTVDVHGTLLMTFRAVDGQGPLYYGGTPDGFNTTIGYFGPSDGDGEGVDPGDADFEGFGEITLRYDPDAKLPDGIPWPIHIAPVANSYREGGGQ